MTVVKPVVIARNNQITIEARRFDGQSAFDLPIACQLGKLFVRDHLDRARFVSRNNLTDWPTRKPVPVSELRLMLASASGTTKLLRYKQRYRFALGPFLFVRVGGMTTETQATSKFPTLRVKREGWATRNFQRQTPRRWKRFLAALRDDKSGVLQSGGRAAALQRGEALEADSALRSA